MISVYSWNVNGIRAAAKKGLLEWIEKERPEILCLQETKARKDQLPSELARPDGYHTYWAEADKPGYSGVALFTLHEPASVEPLGVDEFDREGRTLIADFRSFVLFDCYFPNSQEAGARLDYKLAYCNAVKERADAYVAAGRHVLISGDFNIAHTPLDLARPEANEKNPGYLPEEREWMTYFLSSGYVDTFRMFTKEGGHYTWWTYRFKAREKDIGWRIDYHCVDERFKDKVKESVILKDVMGSDHCPVKITLDVAV
ncbi:exodeoxyribonuclease III [Spirochaeta thermophila]|uniref:Endonuclease/exonuclease/phosphatase domain-containing protein n=1 Tax=Winmispira thermophila (strain ATCC 49972 / DSM 6192 / RI 19.B1) TaxID=665571 RepID=E0RQ08_WINT6|nr:exodeoxyribonuclease III [Spirochaeta thermophila]ADN02861.1 hypothetical protein STHERM_c19260 [Spirochaeta thermophila DSM 6192]